MILKIVICDGCRTAATVERVTLPGDHFETEVLPIRWHGDPETQKHFCSRECLNAHLWDSGDGVPDVKR